MPGQKLLKYISDTHSAQCKTPLRQLAKDHFTLLQKTPQLLCDFSATIKWLLHATDCNDSAEQAQLSPYAILYGGDLQLYSSRVLAFVRLLEQCGIECVFLVDCPPHDCEPSESKLADYRCQCSRERQEVSLVHQVCDGIEGLHRISWRLNQFAALHLESVLKQAGVKMVHVTEALVSEVSTYCSLHEEVCGILSNNTDLIVLRGLKVFLLDQLELTAQESVQAGQESSLEISCGYVTATTLAASLKIKETQLPDLVALCSSSDFYGSLCSVLKLPDSSLTTMAQWLSGLESPLLDYRELEQFLRENTSYQELVRTIHTNSCTKIPTVASSSSIFAYVRECIRNGSMSPYLLGVANGCYWRPVLHESLSIQSPCFVGITLCIRKQLYSLLGVKEYREFGCSQSSSFTAVSGEIETNALNNKDSLVSLALLPLTKKLSILFHILLSAWHLEVADNPEGLEEASILSGPDVRILVAAVVACSAILFISSSNDICSPSPEVAVCELDALLLTCLVSLTQTPVEHFPDRPSSRSITVCSWFTHVLEQCFLAGSLLGLSDSLPLPGDVFIPHVFILLHKASLSPDRRDRRLLDLKPVLRLRAEILNYDRAPSDLTPFISLFVDSLEAVKSASSEGFACVAGNDDNHTLLRISAPDRTDAVSPLSPLVSVSVSSDNLGSSFTQQQELELSSVQDHEALEEQVYLSLHELSEPTAAAQEESQCEWDEIEGESSSGCGLECEKEPTDSSPGSDTLRTAVGGRKKPNSRRKKTRLKRVNTVLPIIEHRDKILELLDNHTVVMIEGETGCGKSTMIPQFILNQCLQEGKPCKIVVTQPRRVAAMRLAERVAAERGEEIGRTVGYCVGGESQRTSRTALTYCTVGYFLQMLLHNSKLLQNFTHIIIDEIHERCISTEFTLLIVRKLVSDLPSLKIILMSATLQGDIFVNYFEQTLPFTEISPSYFVGAKRFHVDTYFINELISMTEQRTTRVWHGKELEAMANIKALVLGMPQTSLREERRAKRVVTDLAMNVCTELIISQGNRGEGILIFLPGISEILSYQDQLTLELRNRQIAQFFSVFVLHSQVPLEDQRDVFRDPPPDRVHVILATNIAESSITLPKLRLVVNFGLYRQLQYDSKRRLSCLKKCWCSRASCAQRAGRVGRVFEGVAIHLFTRRFHRVVLSEFNPPEMVTAPLAKLVLQAKYIAKTLNMSTPSDVLMEAIEPPSLEQLETALKDLADLGAIVSQPNKNPDETAEMTLVGEFSLSLPMDVELCRLVLYGLFFEVSTEAIVIAAEMSLPNDVFSLPSRRLITDEGAYCSAMQRGLDSRVRYDGGEFSDHLIVCRMFLEWINCRVENVRHSRPLSRHTLLRRFCKKKAVRSSRLLLLEMTVAMISTRLLSHVPTDSAVYESIETLSTINKYFELSQKRELRVLFTDDADLVKSLLTAAFSHQMVVGRPEVRSQFPRLQRKATSELSFMAEAQLDPEKCIVMRGVKQKVLDSLHQLVDRLLPGIKCDITTDSNTVYIHFPELEICSSCRTNTPVQLQGDACAHCNLPKCWQVFVREISVFSQKVYRELFIVWQSSERQTTWSAEGISAQFSRLDHPLALSWVNLSVTKEMVGIASFRNPSAFVCDFSNQDVPFLAVATAMQGVENSTFVSAQKITILPSIERSAVSPILTLAFQSLCSDLELLVDRADKTVHGFKIKSQEIIFGNFQTLTVSDLIRVNVLRRAVSKILTKVYPNERLPFRNFARISQLLKSVLSQCPIPVTYSTSEIVMPVGQDKCWEKLSLGREEHVDASECDPEFDFDEAVDGDLSTFMYYPTLSCSILETVSFSESRVQKLMAGTQWEPPRLLSPANSGQQFKLSPLARPFTPLCLERNLSAERADAATIQPPPGLLLTHATSQSARLPAAPTPHSAGSLPAPTPHSAGLLAAPTPHSAGLLAAPTPHPAGLLAAPTPHSAGLLAAPTRKPTKQPLLALPLNQLFCFARELVENIPPSCSLEQATSCFQFVTYVALQIWLQHKRLAQQGSPRSQDSQQSLESQASQTSQWSTKSQGSQQSPQSQASQTSQWSTKSQGSQQSPQSQASQQTVKSQISQELQCSNQASQAHMSQISRLSQQPQYLLSSSSKPSSKFQPRSLHPLEPSVGLPPVIRSPVRSPPGFLASSSPVRPPPGFLVSSPPASGYPQCLWNVPPPVTMGMTNVQSRIRTAVHLERPSPPRSVPPVSPRPHHSESIWSQQIRSEPNWPRGHSIPTQSQQFHSMQSQQFHSMQSQQFHSMQSPRIVQPYSRCMVRCIDPDHIHVGCPSAPQVPQGSSGFGMRSNLQRHPPQHTCQLSPFLARAPSEAGMWSHSPQGSQGSQIDCPRLSNDMYFLGMKKAQGAPYSQETGVPLLEASAQDCRSEPLSSSLHETQESLPLPKIVYSPHTEKMSGSNVSERTDSGNLQQLEVVECAALLGDDLLPGKAASQSSQLVIDPGVLSRRLQSPPPQESHIVEQIVKETNPLLERAQSLSPQESQVVEANTVLERSQPLPPQESQVVETNTVLERAQSLSPQESQVVEANTVLERAQSLPPQESQVVETNTVLERAQSLPPQESQVVEANTVLERAQSLPPQESQVVEANTVLERAQSLPPQESQVVEANTVLERAQSLPPQELQVVETNTVLERAQSLPPQESQVVEANTVLERAQSLSPQESQVVEANAVLERAQSLSPQESQVVEANAVLERAQSLPPQESQVVEANTVLERAQSLPPQESQVVEANTVLERAQSLPPQELQVVETNTVLERAQSLPPQESQVVEANTVLERAQSLPPQESQVVEANTVLERAQSLPPQESQVVEANTVLERAQSLPPQEPNVRKSEIFPQTVQSLSLPQLQMAVSGRPSRQAQSTPPRESGTVNKMVSIVAQEEVLPSHESQENQRSRSQCPPIESQEPQLTPPSQQTLPKRFSYPRSGLPSRRVSHSKKSKGRRRDKSPRPPPHPEPVRRYEHPEVFMNPPFGGAARPAPQQSRVSRRQGSHLLPPLGSSFVARYRTLPFLQPSLPIPKSDISLVRGATEGHKAVAYLAGSPRPREQQERQRHQRHVSQYSVPEDYGISNKDAVSYFKMIHLFFGSLEIELLCGYYYFRFLEIHCIRANILASLDPDFFLKRNSDTFSVSVGEGGTSRISLKDREAFYSSDKISYQPPTFFSEGGHGPAVLAPLSEHTAVLDREDSIVTEDTPADCMEENVRKEDLVAGDGAVTVDKEIKVTALIGKSRGAHGALVEMEGCGESSADIVGGATSEAICKAHLTANVESRYQNAGNEPVAIGTQCESAFAQSPSETASADDAVSPSRIEVIDSVVTETATVDNSMLDVGVGLLQGTPAVSTEEGKSVETMEDGVTGTSVFPASTAMITSQVADSITSDDITITEKGTANESAPIHSDDITIAKDTANENASTQGDDITIAKEDTANKSAPTHGDDITIANDTANENAPTHSDDIITTENASTPLVSDNVECETGDDPVPTVWSVIAADGGDVVSDDLTTTVSLSRESPRVEDIVGSLVSYDKSGNAARAVSRSQSPDCVATSAASLSPFDEECWIESGLTRLPPSQEEPSTAASQQCLSTNGSIPSLENVCRDSTDDPRKNSDRLTVKKSQRTERSSRKHGRGHGPKFGGGYPAHVSGWERLDVHPQAKHSDPQASSKSRDSDPQTNCKSRDSDPQASPKFRNSDPQTSPKSRDSDPQASPKSRDSDPQTSPKSRDSDPQTSPKSRDLVEGKEATSQGVTKSDSPRSTPAIKSLRKVAKGVPQDSGIGSLAHFISFIEKRIVTCFDGWMYFTSACRRYREEFRLGRKVWFQSEELIGCSKMFTVKIDQKRTAYLARSATCSLEHSSTDSQSHEVPTKKMRSGSQKRRECPRSGDRGKRKRKGGRRASRSRQSSPEQDK